MVPAILLGAYSLLALIASVQDARARRYPNRLALAMAALALCLALLSGEGAARLFFCCATSLLLVIVEVVWRALRGTSGLGMGDVKALAGAVLVSPRAAFLSLVLSLLLLAFCCVVARRRSLPFLPFFFPVFLVLLFCLEVCP